MYGDFILFFGCMLIFLVLAICKEVDDWLYEKKSAKLPKEDRGLYNKYQVTRTDGRDEPGGDREGAKYFVLDYVNDPHSVVALKAYIESLDKEDKFKNLSKDLKSELEEYSNEIEGK